MIQADGFEDAIIGVGSSFGRENVLVYNTGEILRILAKRDGMTYDEAREFFEFNVLGSYNGEGMPIFVEEYLEEL